MDLRTDLPRPIIVDCLRGVRSLAATGIGFVSRFTPLRLIALILALLLINPLGPPRVAYAAPPPQFSVLQCGTSSADHILPVPCNPTDTEFTTADYTDIYAFETQAITDYINLHNLNMSVSDFLNVAGKEMRDDVRATMLVELEGVIGMTPSTRTTAQQALYNWFNAWMSVEDAKLYKAAWAEYQAYFSDPCAYQLNATLAKQYNIQFDTTNCSNLGGLFTQPAQPSAEYYLAVGLQSTWGTLLNAPGAVATYVSEGHYAEFALSSSVLGGAVAAGVVSQSFSALAPYAVRQVAQLADDGWDGVAEAGEEATAEAADAAVEAGAEAGAEAVETGFTAVGAAAGVVAIVVVAIIVLVQGAIDFANKSAVAAGLATFGQQYNATQAPGYQYDLVGALSDSTQSYKIQAMWAVLSSNSYDIAAPAIQPGTSPIVQVTTATVDVNTLVDSTTINWLNGFQFGQSTYSASFNNVDWDGRTWSVQLSGNSFFRKTCIAAQSIPCTGPELVATLQTELPFAAAGDISIFAPSIRTLVSRNGTVFQIKLLDDGSGYYQIGNSNNGNGAGVSLSAYPDCAANPATGVSDNAFILPTCGGFVSNVMFFNSAPNNPTSNAATLSYTQVTVVPPPTWLISTTAFTEGTPRAETLGAETSLPPDATAGQGLELVTQGACPGDLVADSPLPSPQFTFTPGYPGTLSYNGDAPGATGLVGYGTYTEHFCAQVLPPIGPSATGAVQVTWGSGVAIVSSTTFTPTAGFPFSQTIYATGTPTPSLKLVYGNVGASYKIFTFTDNGDGSGTISAPASAMTPNFNLDQFAGPITENNPLNCGEYCAAITASNSLSSATVALHVTTADPPGPVITIPPIPAFEAGVPTSFTLSETDIAANPLLYAFAAGTVQPGPQTSANPKRVSFGTTTPISTQPWLTFTDNGNGTGTFSGTAPTGTVASLALEVVGFAYDSTGTIQNLTIPVRSDPVFVTPTSTIFPVGQYYGFEFLTTSQQTIALNQPATLPSGVAFSGQQLYGIAQAGSGGYYPLRLTASNQYGTANQAFSLFISEPPTIYAATPGHVTTFAIHQGMATTVQIPASTGYPKSPPPSFAPSSLGTGLAYTLNTSMPSTAYKFSDTDSSGKLAGNGTFVFNAPVSAIGSYSVSLEGNNGFAPNGFLTLNINIVHGGDVNQDGVVNCTDLDIVKAALNKNQSQTGYDIRADVNLDGVVNIKDYSFVASKLAAGTVCH
jgi:hypothetical protein